MTSCVHHTAMSMYDFTPREDEAFKVFEQMGKDIEETTADGFNLEDRLVVGPYVILFFRRPDCRPATEEGK